MIDDIDDVRLASKVRKMVNTDGSLDDEGVLDYVREAMDFYGRLPEMQEAIDAARVAAAITELIVGGNELRVYQDGPTVVVLMRGSDGVGWGWSRFANQTLLAALEAAKRAKRAKREVE